MRTDRPTLLLTRPARSSMRFAAAFRARFGDDWPVIVSPLTDLVAIGTIPELSGFAGLIFTSEAAVEVFARSGAACDLPAWVVGERTARAARSAGLRTETGPGDARGLCDQIIASGAKGPLLYLRGRHAAFDVATTLNSAGIETQAAIIYDQPECPLSSDALSALRGRTPILVPLFSPRAARLLVEQSPEVHAPLHVAAMSDQVAIAAEGLRASKVDVAREPTADAMLDSLANLVSSVLPT